MFDTIYSNIISREGYYANIAGDAGGMTYAGIARNIYPNWEGWATVDQAIKANGKDLPRNTKIAALETTVKNFYSQLWVNTLANKIVFDPLADLYFDFMIHSSKGLAEIQKVLVARGAKITINNVPNDSTIKAINADPAPAALHDAILDARKNYLIAVSRIGANAQFLEGWLKRLQSFPRLTAGIGTGIVLAAIVVFFALRYRKLS
jgi:lysozyme family protein